MGFGDTWTALPHAPTSLPLSPGQGVYSAWLMGGEAGAGREPRFCSLLNTVFTVKIVASELKVQTSAIRKPCLGGLRAARFPCPLPLQQHTQVGRDEAARG